ncbi:MAG: glycosyltransferase [Candidatus Limiplasma sp.]|nr:glycosyltransferase [Candidatus Limiplasma sp.]
MPPKFTVVTPTYNRADLIRRTIESVLKQTETDFEYLIIDDGSTDQTREVVEPYLQDFRIRYIYQENQGEPATVNRGWKLAKGEYFLQVNSDDPVAPELLQEMGGALDANPEALLAYCDFQFIDLEDHPFKDIYNPDWNFLALLRQFSCVAASPCTTFRRSKLSCWENLRRINFRHINDLEMYWDMALEGDFLHVPKILAYWRVHDGQISHSRYLAIPEIESWFEYYFSKPELPQAVRDCRSDCLTSICKYFSALLNASVLPADQIRKELYRLYKIHLADGASYINLQVGDNDLIGNKFNGHDLHLLLQKANIRSYHYVVRKLSNDETTYCLHTDAKHDFSKQILFGKEFLLSDIVHLHLIHNTNFEITNLPLLTRLKPIVLTLHDPFFFSGHCIYSGRCEKYKTFCADCEYLQTPFSLDYDLTPYYFMKKAIAIQNSNLSIIVASQWMENKAKESPIFAGKKIYHLPFGIDQSLFRPRGIADAKKELGIPETSLTLMFRADQSQFKGLEVIRNALGQIASKDKITLLTVGQKNMLNEFQEKYRILEFGWLTDDKELTRLYQACDIFLMPSRQEAFGMMAIEAMSCAKPVLVLPDTSLPSVVYSPECGLAVEETVYAETLQFWIDHPEERLARGEKSLIYAREHYSLERYIEKLLHIYDDIMVHFTPDPNADIVLSQLLYNALNAPSCPPSRQEVSHSLSYSHSWNFTKPLRAFQHARRMKDASIHARIIYYSKYLKNSEWDVRDDVVIKNSLCWKVTKPLRHVGMLFRRIKGCFLRK